MLDRLRRLLEDPPPDFIFEFSEAGISWARRGKTLTAGFAPLEPGVLSVSPVRDNVLLPEKLEQAVLALAPPSGGKRRRPAALILPDYCGRVAVLDFDSFPSEPQEQMALVRFRVKKSVPFDLEAASVSFHVQPHTSGGKKRDVVVAVVSLEILARYEAPLRVAGLHPGFVTISALAAMNLLQGVGMEVLAKLSGKVLSVAVVENGNLRVFRSVEMDDQTPQAVSAVLFPTFAYVEDAFQRRPERLLLCGFGPFGEAITPFLEGELQTPVASLRGPGGALGPFNAGLMGYLEGARLSLGAAA